MSVTPSSTVVAAFRDRWAAEQAMEALYNAGFSREQMQYVVPGTGGFFEGLKSFFTGSSTQDSDFASSLNEMGLSNEEAQYYAGEYDQGNTILAVMTSGRDEEALNILGQYGAYNARTSSGSAGTTSDAGETYRDAQLANGENPDAPLPREMPSDPTAPFPSEAATSDATAPFPHEIATSDPTAPFPEETASDPATPFPADSPTSDPTASFPPDVSEETDSQASETVSEPILMEVDEIAVAEVPNAPANVYMPSTDELKEIEVPGEQASGDLPEIEEVEDIPRAEDLEVFDQVGEVPGVDGEEQVSEDTSAIEDINLSAAGETAAEQANAISELDEVEVPESQASSPFTGRSTQLQQVLDEIQRTQQQLQQAKAQLEVIKQHEAEYTTARQQLKDLQDELQAVQAELQATKERLGLE